MYIARNFSGIVANFGILAPSKNIRDMLLCNVAKLVNFYS